MKASTTSPSPDDPAVRLTALLETKSYIPFHLDVPDQEFAYIKLSIYCGIATNELFVKLTNGEKTFVEVVDSPLVYPGMGDRIFGMDAADTDIAFGLANQMWEKHKDVLVRR